MQPLQAGERTGQELVAQYHSVLSSGNDIDFSRVLPPSSPGRALDVLITQEGPHGKLVVVRRWNLLAHILGRN